MGHWVLSKVLPQWLGIINPRLSTAPENASQSTKARPEKLKKTYRGKKKKIPPPNKVKFTICIIQSKTQQGRKTQQGE